MTQEHKLLPGRRVRILEGLFAGKEGRVIGSDEAQHLGLEGLPPFIAADACWVMLTFLGDQTPVCFLPTQVSPIEEPNTQAG